MSSREILEAQARAALDSVETVAYWLIERNQQHGEPSARWFAERRCFAQGEKDLWVQDSSRAERFATKKLAEESIRDRFTDDDRYPVLPVATEHMDCAGPSAAWTAALQSQGQEGRVLRNVAGTESGFDYSEGMHTPWVKVTFATKDWVSRDAFRDFVDAASKTSPDVPEAG